MYQHNIIRTWVKLQRLFLQNPDKLTIRLKKTSHDDQHEPALNLHNTNFSLINKVTS